MPGPNDADIQIGAWNQELVINRVKRESLNVNPLEITLDQLRQLYVLLYPMIERDFKHRDDLFNYIETFRKELDAQRINSNTQFTTLRTEFNSHTHIGNLGSPTSTPVIPMTGVIIPPLPPTKTEDILFTLEGNKRLTVRASGKIVYIRRTVDGNVNVAANFFGKKIEDLLFKDAKIFIPFDVGERDSALDSSANFVEGKGLLDL